MRCGKPCRMLLLKRRYVRVRPSHLDGPELAPDDLGLRIPF
jgi:hypothetical protein